MHFIRIDEAFCTGLAKDGMEYMWIEVDDEGLVDRELGFDAKGGIVHRYPGNGRYGQYGIFDMNRFDVPSLHEHDIAPQEFEEAWERPSSV